MFPNTIITSNNRGCFVNDEGPFLRILQIADCWIYNDPEV